MKTICIYDDHLKPNVFIRNIIGDRSFGDVILKRESLRGKMLSEIQAAGCFEEVLRFEHSWELEQLVERLRKKPQNCAVLHIFSGFIAVDEVKAQAFMKKAQYAENNYVCMSGGAPVAFIMVNKEEYCQFLEKYADTLGDAEIYSEGTPGRRFDTLYTSGFLNLGNYDNFLQYISSGFDARFFNSVQGDEYTLVKASENKKKIQAEYRFYHLLPDGMKMWFVMPYDYRETAEGASYRMERYHMPDLAIRWVHGAIDQEEMGSLLNKVFHFLKSREKRPCSREEYEAQQRDLYIEKVRKRMEELKRHPQYPLLEQYLTCGTDYAGGLDGIAEKYERLYHRITDGTKEEYALVIGHGDLCFSNMLFNKETSLLKLIDPKGATAEADLWTDPYYDIAKLSHSVCGRYDFFNSGLHRIVLDERMKLHLEIGFDNRGYKELFRKYVEENGYSFLNVRIYEASLFLSMLPLHMDNPQKVLGFVLNAVDILEEIEGCMRT